MLEFFGIQVDLTQGSAIIRVSHDEKYVVDRLAFESSVSGVTSAGDFLSLVRNLSAATVAAADVTSPTSEEMAGAPDVAGETDPAVDDHDVAASEKADPEVTRRGKF